MRDCTVHEVQTELLISCAAADLGLCFCLCKIFITMGPKENRNLMTCCLSEVLGDKIRK